MNITATVKAGKIVLPPGTPWPSGTRVRIKAVAKGKARAVPKTAVVVTAEEVKSGEDPFLAAVRKLAKPRPHWPKDFALNHGHYVSGEPKKS
jgi:hypothetical protein